MNPLIGSLCLRSGSAVDSTAVDGSAVDEFDYGCVLLWTVLLWVGCAVDVFYSR